LELEVEKQMCVENIHIIDKMLALSFMMKSI
jgi:NADH/NAD ratio-sensing transcriptional regulator Rex